MNKLSSTLLMFTIMLCVPAFVRAQENSLLVQEDSSLSDRIKAAVKEKEPKWELKFIDHISTVQGEDSFSTYLWEDGDKSFIGVSVIISSSPEPSNTWFKFLQGEYAVPKFRQRLLKGSVKNLGDENYLWEDYYDPPNTGGGVTFKQGNFVVRVGSSSKATAERFASHIHEVIKEHSINSNFNLQL